LNKKYIFGLEFYKKKYIFHKIFKNIGFSIEKK